jgi:hypothetical protein
MLKRLFSRLKGKQETSKDVNAFNESEKEMK